MARRRYRVFTLCAIVIVFLLYRAVQNSWDEPAGYGNLRPPVKPDAKPDTSSDGKTDAKLAVDEEEIPHKNAAENTVPETWAEEDFGHHDHEDQKAEKEPAPVKDSGESESGNPADRGQMGTYKEVHEDEKPEDKPSAPAPANEEGISGNPADRGQMGTFDEVHEDETFPPPASKTKEEEETKVVVPDKTVEEGDMVWKDPPNEEDDFDDKQPKVHWTKVPEHFPIPKESIVPLPSGASKDIPKVQFKFDTETEDAKTKRQQRLKMVKAEIERAWGGYKKFAWKHDELLPVSAEHRDPFCGWAATLVDSLDTLHIAGLTEEFEEAVKAVKDLDFTWSRKNEIPVFETTIRYLGGLLGAYDVSGGDKGSHKILLDKAVELAEILMGIFDTPNRMPVLYYSWKPDYASQPHRANLVGIAELATLSLEFTRLAQLTKESKYYDAIDRITNGLVEMQKVGTAIPGLFPEAVDISGCNKTATTIKDNLSAAAHKQVDSEELGLEYEEELQGEDALKYDHAPIDEVTIKTEDKSEEEEEDVMALPEDYAPSNSQAYALDDESHEKRDIDTAAGSKLERRQKSIPTVPKRPDDVVERPQQTPAAGSTPPFAADGKTSQWDCVPQGIVPTGYGFQNFHMGGAQDSAYEYFPKEWLLLGGLESKYRKLYEDTINATNEWLMYRPMIKDADKWDILFPAKLSVPGTELIDIVPTYEITHLTCFVGGMYGLGGKIFNRPEDIETAIKLTDGCVWAYQSMPSGLMAENAKVLPCPTLEKCDFNETQWWESLDGSKTWRDKQMKEWDAKEEHVKANNDEEQRKQAELQEVENEGTGKVTRPESSSELAEEKTQEGEELTKAALDFDASVVDPALGPLQKRAAIPVGDAEEDTTDSQLPDSLKKKLGYTSDEDESNSEVPDVEGASAEEDETLTIPIVSEGEEVDEIVPQIPHHDVPLRAQQPRQKPLSHEEYVAKKIRDDRLPHGITEVTSRQYILRPEAIESVWYMYRITGDPAWMDKGWMMFEATIRATRTEFANSAIDDVTKPEPELRDEMESFWLAETLKYYYLLFAEPDVISLDEWVLNTEAHPFKRPA